MIILTTNNNNNKHNVQRLTIKSENNKHLNIGTLTLSFIIADVQKHFHFVKYNVEI